MPRDEEISHKGMLLFKQNKDLGFNKGKGLSSRTVENF